jgi:hypothetical protein
MFRCRYAIDVSDTILKTVSTDHTPCSPINQRLECVPYYPFNFDSVYKPRESWQHDHHRLDRSRRPPHAPARDRTSRNRRRQSRPARSWSIVYRTRQGQSRRFTLDSTQLVKSVKTAREQALDALRQFRAGQDPQAEKVAARISTAPPPETATFQALADEFLETWVRRRNRPNSARMQVHSLKIAGAEWGKRPITDIRRADVVKLLVSSMPAPLSAPTHCGAPRASFFSWCQEREHVAVSPVAGTKHFQDVPCADNPPRRPRRFQPFESSAPVHMRLAQPGNFPRRPAGARAKGAPESRRFPSDSPDAAAAFR